MNLAARGADQPAGGVAAVQQLRGSRRLCLRQLHPHDLRVRGVPLRGASFRRGRRHLHRLADRVLHREYIARGLQHIISVMVLSQELSSLWCAG